MFSFRLRRVPSEHGAVAHGPAGFSRFCAHHKTPRRPTPSPPKSRAAGGWCCLALCGWGLSPLQEEAGPFSLLPLPHPHGPFLLHMGKACPVWGWLFHGKKLPALERRLLSAERSALATARAQGSRVSPLPVSMAVGKFSKPPLHVFTRSVGNDRKPVDARLFLI